MLIAFHTKHIMGERRFAFKGGFIELGEEGRSGEEFAKEREARGSEAPRPRAGPLRLAPWPRGSEPAPGPALG